MKRLAALAFAGCSFTPGAFGDGDASIGIDGAAGDGTSDAFVSDAPACTFSAWNTPQPISELNVAGVLHARPRLTPDERIIIFYSMRAGGAGDRDLYIATRATTADPFSNITNLTTLNTSSLDRDPAITPDGLEVVYVSSSSGNYEIYSASRATTTDPFGSPALVSAVSSPSSSEWFLSLSHDGLTLYFASDRSGGAGGNDIWFSTRTTMHGTFGAPQNLSPLNSASNDYCTAFSGDGREVLLSTTRGGSMEIYAAKRADAGAAWGTPIHVSELTAGGEDHPGWLSVDRLRFYYSNQSTGTSQLYLATRTCD